MREILIIDHGEQKKAVFIKTLPPSEEELWEVVSVLMGEHPASSEVLRDVTPGSVPHGMGAKKLIYLVFEELVQGEDSFERGVYAAGTWVREILNPAMPEGWGAAMSQPMMFPLVVKDGGNFEVTGHFEWLDAEVAGTPRANGIIVSPMERAVTGPITGHYLDSNPDVPVLSPIY